MSAPPPASNALPSVLLPELLGFVPQFLLDDIIDTANDSVRQAVDAMEVFLRRWVDNRAQKVGDEWDPSQDLEQGLVAFQTLLYSHVDIAFDFFEAWSLRNIFAIPPGLPIVAPHQRGLDLTREENAERDLITEIEDLRRKIHAVCQSSIVLIAIAMLTTIAATETASTLRARRCQIRSSTRSFGTSSSTSLIPPISTAQNPRLPPNKV